MFKNFVYLTLSDLNIKGILAFNSWLGLRGGVSELNENRILEEKVYLMSWQKV